MVIADSANNRVDEFSVTLNPGKEVSGVAFVAGMGWNVRARRIAPLEKFQICTTTTGCQAGAAGGKVGQFTDRGLTRVAVDAHGAIYALNSPNIFAFCNATIRHCHVQKIDPARSAASEFAPAQLNLTAGFIQQNAASEIAVDPTNDDVYVAKPHRDPEVDYQILRFDSAGNLLERYPPFGGIGVKEEAAFGLAFDHESGSLYVTSTTGGQRIFELSEQPLSPPTAVTGGAGPGANFSLETLEGTVNPNGFTVLGCRSSTGRASHTAPARPACRARSAKGPNRSRSAPKPNHLSRRRPTTTACSPKTEVLRTSAKTAPSPPAPPPKAAAQTKSGERKQGIAALALPECMALEMVSPPKKGGQSASSPGSRRTAHG